LGKSGFAISTIGAGNQHRRDGQSQQPQGKAIRRAIRAAGARLFFLPPYSPDLNIYCYTSNNSSQ
jgi:transposase